MKVGGGSGCWGTDSFRGAAEGTESARNKYYRKKMMNGILLLLAIYKKNVFI